FRLETGCAIQEVSNVVKSAANPGQRSVDCTSGVACSIERLIPVVGPHEGSFPRSTNSEGCVQVHHATKGVLKTTLGKTNAGVGMGGQVPSDAKHVEVSVLTCQRVGCGNQFTRRAVISKKCANRVMVQLPGKPCTKIGLFHQPREQKVLAWDNHRYFEVAGVFSKKWSFVRVKDLITLVDSKLRIIGLNLAKVWPRGHI